MAGDGEHTIAAEMNEEEISGLHEVEVRDAKGKPDTVAVEIKYRRIHVLPPIGSRSAIPRSTSRCCTPRSVRNQSIGQGSTGS
ncbi:hypothetical protein [Mesorhizobium tianshanense]|uniref:hypothetical protein n=1 Tax=Mesorhizobium tianshanense TaxID=39844 RepID=UPI001ABEF21E|nr:hypothetical protein [Mesorhizobium tianshanense]